ncbi:MAG: tRNA pseudouridine(13) synthase TruD [Polyangiaceae bacterium]|nr:tRNA pseudouridine(13) synthase TruD [Polyangiaceae bacterium]
MPNPDDNLPAVSFKERPEDFVVDEVPAYEPSGEGDHLYVTFRKTSLTTDEAVRRLARALGVDARDAGVAGMKDKHAVTSQTVSFLVPRSVDHEAALRALEGDGLEVMGARRHGNKLKPGHLKMNRFRIVLRGVSDPALRAQIGRGLEDAKARGVPNAYGSQRFGADADNEARALAFVRGERPPPKDKRKLRFLFSALQSALFNRVLERRVADGSWADVLPGDLAKKHDTGGLFLVAAEGPELEDARARARASAISATGPMFGSSMRRPEGAPAALEAAVLAEAGLDADTLERFRHAGEGTRRALRLLAEELAWSDGPDGALVVELALGKGGYATTFLGSVCRLVEPTRGGPTAPTEDAAEGSADAPG